MMVQVTMMDSERMIQSIQISRSVLSLAVQQLTLLFSYRLAGGAIKNLQAGSVSVKVAGSALSADSYTVNYEKGLINITISAAVNADQKVTASYKALHYGTPSWADFKGVHGAMYVLLKR